MLQVVRLHSGSNVMLGAWPPGRWQVPVFWKSCCDAVKDVMPHKGRQWSRIPRREPRRGAVTGATHSRGPRQAAGRTLFG